MPNPICHFEICVNDKAKGLDFYGKVFDWKFQSDPNLNYSMISTGVEPGGEISQAMGEMKPYVTVYVTVDDINTTIDKAVAIGAHEIVRKTKISDEYGFYGMFADPDGTVIGLWSKT